MGGVADGVGVERGEVFVEGGGGCGVREVADEDDEFAARRLGGVGVLEVGGGFLAGGAVGGGLDGEVVVRGGWGG